MLKSFRKKYYFTCTRFWANSILKCQQAHKEKEKEETYGGDLLRTPTSYQWKMSENRKERVAFVGFPWIGLAVIKKQICSWCKAALTGDVRWPTAPECPVLPQLASATTESHLHCKHFKTRGQNSSSSWSFSCTSTSAFIFQDGSGFDNDRK